MNTIRESLTPQSYDYFSFRDISLLNPVHSKHFYLFPVSEQLFPHFPSSHITASSEPSLPTTTNLPLPRPPTKMTRLNLLLTLTCHPLVLNRALGLIKRPIYTCVKPKITSVIFSLKN